MNAPIFHTVRAVRDEAIVPNEAPHSIDAEQSVLGGLLIDNESFDRVADAVSESDFYRDDHRRIFRHIARLVERGKPADVVTVDEAIKGSEDRDKTGGLAYLAALAGNTPSAHNVRRYGEIVRDYSERRKIQSAAMELHDRAARGDLEDAKAELAERVEAIRTKRKTSVALDLAQLAAREPPERKWAIFGWILMGAAMLLAGPGGVGKTRLMLQIAACLVLGRNFIDTVSCQLRVLVWACEDDADELWRILAQIAKWLGVPLDALADGLLVVPRLGLDNTIYSASEYGRPMFTPVLEELRAQAREHRAQVVFLDNIAHIYGGREGDRHQVTECVNGLMGAVPLGCALVMLAHPAKAAGSEYSGSTAWENSVRSRLYLGFKLPDQKQDDDEPSDDDARYLARRKANHAAKDWRRFEYRDGVLVPDPAEASGGIVGHARELRAESVVLDGLRRLQELAIFATEGTTSPRFLPRLLIEYRLADGHGKQELAAAMRRLIMVGKLARAEVGRSENRHPVFGLKAV